MGEIDKIGPAPGINQPFESKPKVGVKKDEGIASTAVREVRGGEGAVTSKVLAARSEKMSNVHMDLSSANITKQLIDAEAAQFGIAGMDVEEISKQTVEKFSHLGVREQPTVAVNREAVKIGLEAMLMDPAQLAKDIMNQFQGVNK